MTGGGAGKVIIWDIEKGESIKTFIETGVYHRDANILNEVFDGKFSYCGKFFAVTTVWGTITIFSIFDKESYLATPVEQFFQYDKLPEATSNIYNENDAVLCNYDRMKYPNQPPLPILGERYIGRTMDPFDYNFGFHCRYDTFSKDQKYFENYVDQYGAYAFLITALDSRANEDNASDSQNQRENSDSSEPRRQNRSMYYDPNNDQFDRESDEDFIVDSSPGFGAVRRTVRRTDNREDNKREERKNERHRQRNERRNRVKERNRRRNDDSVDDPEDYVIEDEGDHDISEDSEDSLLRDAATNKKPVVRNHNFYSSRLNDDEEESEEIIEERPRSMSKPNAIKYSGPLSSNRVIVEEEKDTSLKSAGQYFSRNSKEEYKFEKRSTDDGYYIDSNEAIKMQNEDKSLLDCGICKKKRGEHTLIGPFKYYIKDRETDEMVYWFHRECLERNDIVKQVSKYEFENIQE